MQSLIDQKMSKRDLARRSFVREHRRKQIIKKSVRLTVMAEKARFDELMENKGRDKLKYMELVEDINQQTKALMHAEKPLVLHEGSKEM